MTATIRKPFCQGSSLPNQLLALSVLDILIKERCFQVLYAVTPCSKVDDSLFFNYISFAFLWGIVDKDLGDGGRKQWGDSRQK